MLFKLCTGKHSPQAICELGRKTVPRSKSNGPNYTLCSPVPLVLLWESEALSPSNLHMTCSFTNFVLWILPYHWVIADNGNEICLQHMQMNLIKQATNGFSLVLSQQKRSLVYETAYFFLIIFNFYYLCYLTYTHTTMH